MKIQHHFWAVIGLAAFTPLSAADEPVAPDYAPKAKPMDLAKSYIASGQYDKALPILRGNINEPGVQELIRQVEKIVPEELSELETKLRKIIIPKVKFDQAPLSEVLTYLEDQTADLMDEDEKSTPKFVYQGAVQQAQATKVTLNIHGLDVPSLLKYIGGQTHNKIAYEEDDVTLSPYIPEPVKLLSMEELRAIMEEQKSAAKSKNQR